MTAIMLNYNFNLTVVSHATCPSMRRPSPLQPPLLRAEIEIISSCPGELKWEKGEGTNGASSSGGEGTLVTGRVFSWGQTRMQHQRWIRSGWNFADRRIWLHPFLLVLPIMFPVCAREHREKTKNGKICCPATALLIVVLCFLRLGLATSTTSIFRILIRCVCVALLG